MVWRHDEMVTPLENICSRFVVHPSGEMPGEAIVGEKSVEPLAKQALSFVGHRPIEVLRRRVGFRL